MELEAENWRLCSTTVVRRVAGELELGSGKMRTGDLVVQLEQRSIWGAGGYVVQP